MEPLQRIGLGIQSFRDRITRRSYALNRLDHKLDAIMRLRNGMFVEAGANNGKSQSNTLFLERCRGWKGILVEPIPELYEACRTYRTKCRVFNAALVSDDYPSDTIQMEYCNLMSLVSGAMKTEGADADHIARGAEVQGVQPYTLTVPARTLSSILDDAGIQQIDLLSLDVEGFEGSALRGLDLDRHAPTYILVEQRFPEEIESYLGSRYEAIGDLSHHDRLYCRRDRLQRAA